MLGLGDMDPKKMQKLMKKLNIDVEEIDAYEVIIKCKSKNIIISKPNVMVVDMSGSDVFQITGQVTESSKIDEKDVEMVMEKTGKDRETVEKKLEELNNDLAKAIMELQEKK